MDQKRATLVGLDHYSAPNELHGCCKDAQDLSTILARHESGNRRNFQCTLITDAKNRNLDSRKLKKEIDDLFSSPTPCVLFYYAGHAVFDSASSKGNFIVPGKDGLGEEVPFDYLLERANSAFEDNILSTVIILDCCGAGSFGDISRVSKRQQTSEIGNGVTILSASGRTQQAFEHCETGGLFTQYMIEGLKGSAADIRGWVSAASLYSHIDHMLGDKGGQRPVYKANVQTFVKLRDCNEKIPIETLLELPRLFREPGTKLKLDPSFEPDRKNIPEELQHIPQNPKNVAVFKKLQSLNRQGLVVPIGAEHMYYAAINSKQCCLTELGKHYRRLAELDRL